MKYTITSLFLLFSLSVSAQLEKGTWLVGGSGSFRSTSDSYTSPGYSQTSDRTDIAISPSAGYFVIDKLAVGLKSNFSKFKSQVNGSGGLTTNTNRFSFGPFARYYFLEKDKQFNILADVNYLYGRYWFKPTKGNSNSFNASAGLAAFFNTTVALEVLLGYYNFKETVKESGDFITKQSGFQATIGFQIHLQNKNE